MQGNTEGFTILEVTMFLALSGLLLLVMFTGTGMMASRQRFTDTTDSLQVFFQSQYDEVLNGVNVRDAGTSCSADGADAAALGKSQCLLLGKLLTLDAGGETIKSSYIISTKQLTGSEMGDQAKLVAAQLEVVTNSQTSYELKWSAAVSEATRSTSLPSGSGRGSVNSIAFLRLPDANRIIQLYYRDETGNLTTGLNDAVANDIDAYSPVANASGASLAVCVKNDNDFAMGKPRSAVEFGQGLGAGTIVTDYNPGETLCSL
jgi:type II secretory pathway pseudopilin PulG